MASPPIHALYEGDARAVRGWLDSGADPNTRLRHAETPLMICARANATDCVELLLAHSAIDLDAVDQNGQSALFFCVATCSDAPMRMLLARGADSLLRDLSGRDALADCLTRNFVIGAHLLFPLAPSIDPSWRDKLGHSLRDLADSHPQARQALERECARRAALGERDALGLATPLAHAQDKGPRSL